MYTKSKTLKSKLKKSNTSYELRLASKVDLEVMRSSLYDMIDEINKELMWREYGSSRYA